MLIWMGDVAEDEVPKCCEELIENGRLLGLVEKWILEQVVVQDVITFRFFMLPAHQIKLESVITLWQRSKQDSGLT